MASELANRAIPNTIRNSPQRGGHEARAEGAEAPLPAVDPFGPEVSGIATEQLIATVAGSCDGNLAARPAA